MRLDSMVKGYEGNSHRGAKTKVPSCESACVMSALS